MPYNDVFTLRIDDKKFRRAVVEKYKEENLKNISYEKLRELIINTMQDVLKREVDSFSEGEGSFSECFYNASYILGDNK